MKEKVEIIDTFTENLEKERKSLGLTQSEFADALGISLSAYRKIISGETQKLDVFLFVRLHMLTGKFAYEFLGLDNDICFRIVTKLVKLSQPQLSHINSVVEFEKIFALNHEDYEDYIAVHIPLGDVCDGMIYDTSHIEYVNVAKYRKMYGDRLSFGIKLPNNSFAPAYNEDDILLCSRERLKDGDIGLFVNKTDKRTYLRKYEKGKPSKLQPLNHIGVAFEINEKKPDEYNNWIFFAKVLRKIR